MLSKRKFSCHIEIVKYSVTDQLFKHKEEGKLMIYSLVSLTLYLQEDIFIKTKLPFQNLTKVP